MNLLERFKRRKESMAIVDPELMSIAIDYKNGKVNEEDLENLIKPIEEVSFEATGIVMKIIPVPIPGEYLGFEFKFPDDE